MSVFWAIVIGATTLVLIPLAFDWSKELRRRKAHDTPTVGDGSNAYINAYIAGGTDYLPGLGGHQSHDSHFAGACDSPGSDFGDCGDGGGGDGGGGGGD